MKGNCGPVAGCLLAIPVLLGLAAIPAAAVEPVPVVLTNEQNEDRANFISQVKKAR